MLDAQVEELSAQIGLFRPKVDKDAIDGSGEELKEAQTELGLKAKLSSQHGLRVQISKPAPAGKWGGESKKLTVPNATAGSRKRSKNLPTKKTRSSRVPQSRVIFT